jgi:hypothetical protein
MLFLNGLNHTLIEPAKNIQGHGTTPNILLAILGNILEVEELTNRNQESSQWANRNLKEML